MNIERQRKRLTVAITITVLCAIVAMGAIIATAATHNGVWLNLVIAAIAVGVASQVWLIVGAMRDR
jgi:hypothetical protein